MWNMVLDTVYAKTSSRSFLFACIEEEKETEGCKCDIFCAIIKVTFLLILDADEMYMWCIRGYTFFSLLRHQ